MKKILLALMMLCSMCAVAQDVIVKTDGSTIVCRVQNLTTTEVVYKKWSNLKGPNYAINRSEVSLINYEKGRSAAMSPAGKNHYSPGNQSDGTWRLNDNALARMNDVTEYQKKAKIAKYGGYIGGGLLAGFGIVCGIQSATAKNDWDRHYALAGGMIVAGAGVAVGGYFLSEHFQKKSEMMQVASLYEQEISYNNGSSLAIGVDLMRDNSVKTDAWGIGLKYNF